MGEPWPQIIKIVSTAFGGAAGYLFGGWDVLINLLLLLVVVDWLSGWAAAWMRGELKSRVGFKGIIRKVTIFVVVAIAHFIDQALGSLRYFQDAVVFFYLANELLSVIENMGKMGLPMPDILRNAVQIFESKKAPQENPNLIEEAQPEAVKVKDEEAAISDEPPPSTEVGESSAANDSSELVTLVSEQNQAQRSDHESERS
ncbi:phage holin family protein [Paenibacillus hunanensis]|uniref:phage holin family protein n=1 Tax=Paenibacillus hunanensis TaxID=539262 RepID=UPI002027296A|nr:phage holin family protein [Paenibacillus hunanensis]MCL9659399.1 phage holin family protein [Paenibacillus hunanensis]